MPLSGLRVVDLTRILAGPFCSMMLGDMGAEVIKIETPGEGDPVRRQGAIRERLSWYFAGFNRNKRSLTLDLRQEAGREVLVKLIAGSDVLVENYRPGVLARMGFDEARLKALNPNLICCHLSGFGSSGPYCERPSFDFIAQAMSGFMSVTGEPDGPPLRAGPPIADLVAGLYGGARHLRGPGAPRPHRHAATPSVSSLNNGMISMLGFLAANHLATGEAAGRAPATTMRSSRPTACSAPPTARSRSRRARRQSYQRLLDALGAPELRDHPRFPHQRPSRRQPPAMNAAIEERLEARTSPYWIEKLNAAGVPCDRIMTLREVFADPQVQNQEMVLSAEHPGHGEVKMLGFPIKFSEAPCRIRRPAPDLGADTDAILSEIGYAPEEISRLREDAIV